MPRVVDPTWTFGLWTTSKLCAAKYLETTFGHERLDLGDRLVLDTRIDRTAPAVTPAPQPMTRISSPRRDQRRQVAEHALQAHVLGSLDAWTLPAL